jgi:MoaA/NifB/PqqE/SkfB family radical SAM enzyme
VPFLKKEILRGLAIKTGVSWATPSSYYVMCTFRCNFKCNYCPQAARRTPHEPELPRETMLRIVRESKELSGTGFNISVSGGEPLVYPPIYEAMELAHQLGVNFGITTNGYLLTAENVKRIVAAHPFNINISLDSVDPRINEAMRPTPGATQRVLKSCESLLAEQSRTGARFGIFIKPTVTEINYRSLPQMVRHFGKRSVIQVNPQNYYLIEKEGAKQFWVQDTEAFSTIVDELIALRAEGYGLVPTPEALRGMVEYFRSPPLSDPLHQDPAAAKACVIGYRNLFINPDGAAFFCEPLGTVGNVVENSLHEVWRGHVAEQKRRAALKCRVNCQMTCRRSISLFAKARAFLRMG